jgi:cytochrome c biogenesis protein CcmG/thiol:disulfide interchange protein DsbE
VGQPVESAVYLTRRWLLLGGAALALVACRADEAPAPVAGKRAPDFSAARLPQGTVRLSDLAGKPVVLNFFATWCQPCTKELPSFQRLAGQFADKELSFLLVDLQEDPDDVAVFLDNLKITLPTAIDERGEIVKTYRVRGLPSTFFIGRDQVIRMAQLGALTDSLLDEGISKII